VGYCASLGILDQEDFKILREAGVSRYHHNLETSESLFSRLCTTHAYEDRVKTIRGAKEAGFTVCAGGIFGVGETNEQVLELALALRELQVDAVPINFLLPIKGTQLERAENLTPEHCLRIISLFRYVMPQKEIIICGGRETNLGRSHPLVFSAGASGIMTGDYLTTKGRSMGDDLRMLEALGLRVREKGPA
jgi:biotin synthase